MSLKVSLRIATVQLNSQINQPFNSTLNRLKSLLNASKLKDNLKPHVLLLPELALTGYSYSSQTQLKNNFNKDNYNRFLDFFKKLSQDWNCYSIVGYPEINYTSDKFYNSAIVINPSGNIIFNYRKFFLYEQDKCWNSIPNTNFETFSLKFDNLKVFDTITQRSYIKDSINLKCSIGICMDLNPCEFISPFTDFEFATYCLDNDCNLVFAPMNWLHSSSFTSFSKEDEKFKKFNNIKDFLSNNALPSYGSQNDFQIDVNSNSMTERISSSLVPSSNYTDLDKPDMSNINYWITRFAPFLNLPEAHEYYSNINLQLLPKGKNSLNLPKESFIGLDLISNKWKFKGKNMVTVVANRTGIEYSNTNDSADNVTDIPDEFTDIDDMVAKYDRLTVYAGSSGIYKFNGKQLNDDVDSLDSTNNSVELLGNLGKGKEGILQREVDFLI